MADYVCDFEAVNNIINYLNKSIEALLVIVEQNKVKTELDVAGWSGEAKDAYVSGVEAQNKTLIAKANELTTIVEAFKNGVSVIENTEEALACRKI